jgi:sugar-specific transcriptional regulator TrmB
MAQIKTINLIASILKQTPNTADAIAQQSGVHIRSVYRYINWIDEMSRTFEHKVERKVVNGTPYYHLRPFD